LLFLHLISQTVKPWKFLMILGIDHIIYATDRMEESRRFFSDWGLAALPDEFGAAQFETLSGGRVSVKSLAEAGTEGQMETGPSLREVIWGVASQEHLDLLHKSTASLYVICAISCKNNSALKEFSLLDPHGLKQTFRVSQQKAVTVKGSPSNPYGMPQRINSPSPVYERAQPVEIGHVVLFTDRLKEAVAFYESLGFVMSDSYPGRGAFLRCSATGGHHDVFLLQLPPGTDGKSKVGLNHVAFTVRDIHEVFGGGLAMSRLGWKTQLGPGRHPISSAYFWYFECPAGGLIEYNADEDQLTPDWQPREFTPGPTVFAEWAIDGGIDGHTRRQAQVNAGSQFLTEKRP
jgi:catechol 2,3-dioxygenase-like lactoylglutathione lyase family enzyme